MTDQLQIDTTQNVRLGFQIAPLGDRIVAHILDALIKLLYMMVVGIGVSLIVGNIGQASNYLWILAFSPILFYHLLFEIFNNGQSPGKRALQLRVASIHGQSVTIGSYLFRWLFRLVDFQLFSGLVALIAVAVSDKGQRIGDIIAGTTVIKQESQQRLKKVIFQDLSTEHTITYHNAHMLSPDEIQLAREVLNRYSSENLEPHAIKLAEKLAHKLNVTEYVNPRRFLRNVVKDYTHLKR